MKLRIHGIMAVIAMTWAAGAFAGPNLEVPAELVFTVEQGTTGTGTVVVASTGDEPLDWVVESVLPQSWAVQIVREFEITWSAPGSTYYQPRTLTYDATRDVLWVGYYNKPYLAKLSPTTGAQIGGDIDLGALQPLSLDMEGGDLWMIDTVTRNFVRLDPDAGMSVTLTIPKNSKMKLGGDPEVFAREAGRFYAGKKSPMYSVDNKICRLDPASPCYWISDFQIGNKVGLNNQFDYANGSLWQTHCSVLIAGGGYDQNNLIHRADSDTGETVSTIWMHDWNDNAVHDYPYPYYYDISFASATQCWILSKSAYYGDHRVMAHLLDVGNEARFVKDMNGGLALPGGESTNMTVNLDADGLAIGWYPMTLKFNQGPDFNCEVPTEVTFVVHAPGANDAPTADAGPDQVLDATGPTTPVTLDGSGSSDPNGDKLKYEWTLPDYSILNEESPTLELAPGVYDYFLKVDDLRGGIGTNSVRVTVRSPIISVPAQTVAITPVGGAPAAGTTTVANTGDMTLNWTVTADLYEGWEAWRFSKDASSGSITSGGAADSVGFTFDVTGLALGQYHSQTRVRFERYHATGCDQRIGLRGTSGRAEQSADGGCRRHRPRRDDLGRDGGVSYRSLGCDLERPGR